MGVRRTLRPRTVLLGTVLTYVGAALSVALGVLVIVGSTDTAFLVEATSVSTSDPLPLAARRTLLLTVGGMIVIAGLVVALLGTLAARRRQRPRLLLTFCGACYVLLAVFFGLDGQPVAWATAAYVAAAVVLFWVGGANAWYRGDDAHEPQA